MTDDFTGTIDPKDLAEFHLDMDRIKKVFGTKDHWRNMLTPLRRILRKYAPKLPGQKYVRTYHLRRNWQYVVHTPEKAAMYNNSPYAGWVQGIEQASIHEGRWPVAIVQADEYLDKHMLTLWQKIKRIWTK